MRTTWIALALIAPTLALAQERSDLMPTPPPAPPGSAGVYYPGMPVPQAPAVETPGTLSKSGAAKGPEGRIIFDDQVGEEAGGPPGEIPDTYVVKKGDTLWDISGSFFKNPWYWPKLWALNPSITNPHWIYPGDVLKLAIPGAAPAPAPTAAGPRRILGPRLDTGLYLRADAFIEPGELAAAGTIVASKEEKKLLGALDEAYVEFPPNHPLEIGERYSVYHVEREVRHPVTGKKVGDIVEIYGDVLVKAVTNGKLATVQVVDSLNTIERGFRVGPLRRTFRRVEPRAADRNLAGVVVATLHPIGMMAPEMLAFVDRGRKDGVVLGQKFEVVRRGDGYRPVTATGPLDDRRFPREVVGDLVVVDLRDKMSTGVLLNADEEINVGDAVESRAGR